MNKREALCQVEEWADQLGLAASALDEATVIETDHGLRASIDLRLGLIPRLVVKIYLDGKRKARFELPSLPSLPSRSNWHTVCPRWTHYPEMNLDHVIDHRHRHLQSLFANERARAQIDQTFG